MIKLLRRFSSFVRAGYPDAAPHTGHAAVLALCPGAYKTVTANPRYPAGR